MQTIRQNIHLKTKLLLGSLLILLLSACEPSSEPATNNTPKTKSTNQNSLSISDQAEAYIVTNKIWQQGLTALNKLTEQAHELKKSSEVFLLNPTNDLLLNTINEWQKTQILHEQFYPFLSISNETISPDLDLWKNKIAPRQLQPGYLDSVGGYTDSGIVNDISLPITKESIRQQHQLTDTEELTLGLYAIEFILLGDNFSDNENSLAANRFTEQTTIPASLSNTDLSLIELPNNRRRNLLKVQLELLIDDLESLSKHWQINGDLHSQFFKLDSSEKLLGYYDGFISTLNNIDQELPDAIDTTQNQIDLIRENFETRSKKHAILASEEQLKTIDSICCKNTINKETITDNQAKLEANKARSFSDILSEQDKKNILVKIYDIKKRLNKN